MAEMGGHLLQRFGLFSYFNGGCSDCFQENPEGEIEFLKKKN